MLLSEHIRHQREKLGFSQELLAEKIGVSRQAVSKWETGLSYPSTQKLVMLADLFGISVTELLHGKEKTDSAPSAERERDYSNPAPATEMDAEKEAGGAENSENGADEEASKDSPCPGGTEKCSQNSTGAGNHAENSNKKGRRTFKKRMVAAICCAAFVCLAATISAVLLKKPGNVPGGEVSPTAGAVSADPTGSPNASTELPSAEPSAPYEKEYFTNRFPEKGEERYAPLGKTDEELFALAAANLPSENAPLSFLTYDYRSTGVIYVALREFYDTFPKIEDQSVRGWTALDKSLCGFSLDGKNYFWNNYDDWYWETQPYVRLIDGTCFVWFSNIVGLSDQDGGWRNRDRFLLFWYENAEKRQTGERHEARCTFYCEARDRLTRVKNEGGAVTFLTDDALFSNLPFSGEGYTLGAEIWYALAEDKVGILSEFRKYPPENLPQDDAVVWLSSPLVPDEVKAYAMRGEDGKCYIRIEGYASFPWFTNERMSPIGRALFCWTDEDGAVCRQTFICRE